MSTVFRGKFLAGLQDSYNDGQLEFGDACAQLKEPEPFRRWMKTLYCNEWVVYAKRPFGGPEQVFNYLGRYTHRVGLSNRRLRSFDETGVCFATKNGKTVTVAPTEFIRRFLLHVLPKAFVKIRHYGLHASSNATTTLEVAREKIVGTVEPSIPAPEPPAGKTWRDRLLETTGIDITLCTACGRACVVRVALAIVRATPDATSTRRDTS
jgi:hypothetical protein